MAEKYLREENFQIYLRMRSCECATKKSKQKYQPDKGKGQDNFQSFRFFRVLLAFVCWFTPVNANSLKGHCSESGSRHHKGHPQAARAVKLLLTGK